MNEPETIIEPESFTPIDRVRAARALANLTQPECAKRLGVSLATYKRLESGTRPLSTDTLLSISEICNVPPRFMLRGFTEEHDPIPDRDPANVLARLDTIDERMDWFEAATQRIEAALAQLVRARARNRR